VRPGAGPGVTRFRLGRTAGFGPGVRPDPGRAAGRERPALHRLGRGRTGL